MIKNRVLTAFNAKDTKNNNVNIFSYPNNNYGVLFKLYSKIEIFCIL